MQSTFQSILDPYKICVERALKVHVDQLGPKSPLRDACEYALLNGGKRFRPALVLMIAKVLGFGVDVTQAAMGIEFFHTASLIADDLPCMDNDEMRRNQPTTHRIFGESTALLATYALISAGYACLAKNSVAIRNSRHPFAHQSDHICLLALENASYNTGLFGATGGQYLDLSPPSLSQDVVREVLQKKTVTLFEISFVFGWLFGGGDVDLLPVVKQGAAHFGMAFQIADDLDDMDQDQANNHPLNFANVFGKQEAMAMFHEEITSFRSILKELHLEGNELELLIDCLSIWKQCPIGAEDVIKMSQRMS